MKLGPSLFPMTTVAMVAINDNTYCTSMLRTVHHMVIVVHVEIIYKCVCTQYIYMQYAVRVSPPKIPLNSLLHVHCNLKTTKL